MALRRRVSGIVAATGLVLLTVSLTCRTSWLLLGGLASAQPSSQHGGSAEQRAAQRFCAAQPAGGGGDRRMLLNPAAPGQLAAGERGAVTWEEIDELISRPAALHGRQAKAGLPGRWRAAMGHMVNQAKWLPPGLPPSLTPEITQWLNASARWNDSGSLRPASNVEVRSPLPSCHYLVDHKHRAIFVRTTKIGGTTLTNVLGFANHPVACRMDPRKCYELCKGRPMCLEYMTKPEEVEAVWGQYTVFAFVRNPWARAISSFHYNNKRAIRPHCRMPFKTFAAAPSMQGALCYRRYDTCCRERYGFVLEHLEPQAASCLFTEDGRPAVDFIGRSEHFDEDFQDLVELLNSRRRPETPALNIGRVKRLNTGIRKSDLERRRAYAHHYVNNSALCDIRSYFHDDFQLLNFSSW